MQCVPVLFTIVVISSICLITTDGISLSEGIFGNTQYKGQRKSQHGFFSLFYPPSRLTDTKYLPKTPVKAVEPQANFNARQDMACTITYDGECIPEALAINPKYIYSRTICGPGWVCYE